MARTEIPAYGISSTWNSPADATIESAGLAHNADYVGPRDAYIDPRKRIPVTQYALDQKQGRFNQLFPLLKSGFGQFSSFGQPPGGQSGPGPAINAGPVWNDQMVQRQVNNQRAGTDASTEAQMREAGQSTGGRGFGADSPLLAALRGQIQSQGLSRNADTEQNIRWNAAQGNAAQQLKGQTAQESQFASRMGEDIERRKTQASSFNALLAALSGLS